MLMIEPVTDLSALSPEEKKRRLFLRQKETLDLFLARNAISREQYDRSLGDLMEKMGFDAEGNRVFCKEVANEERHS